MSDWTKIMGDLKVVFELPEELVTRAKAVGIRLDSQTDQITALLEVIA